MNLKLRFKNKVVLTAIILWVLSFAYFILNKFGVIPPFEQQELVDYANGLIDVLVLIGVITDPTTSGIGDSARAMNYEKPWKDEE